MDQKFCFPSPEKDKQEALQAAQFCGIYECEARALEGQDGGFDAVGAMQLAQKKFLEKYGNKSKLEGDDFIQLAIHHGQEAQECVQCVSCSALYFFPDEQKFWKLMEKTKCPDCGGILK